MNLDKYSDDSPIPNSQFSMAAKQYSLVDFMSDLTKAFKFDRDNFLSKIQCEFFKDKIKANPNMQQLLLFEKYLDVEIDFLTNWILLCANRCTLSFITLFAISEKNPQLLTYTKFTNK